MKLNKLISKGLALGITLNSISVISYANTEVPNRYQTIEGEYITIDDSTEGNLEEIEIFGNTVQDPNNLEDIQSVGDLYVDENGNPILDSQGREQYKIDILSFNTNQWDGKMTNTKTTDYIKVYNGQFSSNAYDCYITEYDYNFNVVTPRYLTGGVSNTMYKLKSNDCKYIKIESNLFNPSDRYYVEGGLLLSSFDIIKMGQVPTCYFKENKTTILLPTQLQKVGNVADRLYWDNVNSRYIVEKNIGKNNIDEFSKINSSWDGELTQCFQLYLNPPIKPISGHTDNVICSRQKYNGSLYGIDIEGVHQDWDNVKIRFLKSKIGDTIDSFKQYINSTGGMVIYYRLQTPQLIVTNITTKIKVSTYANKTHIFAQTENGINPNLKVVIDKLPQIAKEAVAQAKSDSSNHNISLARRYINMLPESSYKDQLQEQLSEIFSSDMVLDVKTATSNLDVYIKSENILQMSLDTNHISFDDFSGIEDVVKENVVNVTINSSLPYQINAYLPTEIQNSDKSKILDKSILNIKESSSNDYQTFTNTTDKIVLKDNCNSGNYLTHGVDLKLAGGIAHEKDVYKATIKLEAEQK